MLCFFNTKGGSEPSKASSAERRLRDRLLRHARIMDGFRTVNVTASVVGG